MGAQYFLGINVNHSNPSIPFSQHINQLYLQYISMKLKWAFVTIIIYCKFEIIICQDWHNIKVVLLNRDDKILLQFSADVMEVLWHGIPEEKKKSTAVMDKLMKWWSLYYHYLSSQQCLLFIGRITMHMGAVVA